MAELKRQSLTDRAGSLSGSLFYARPINEAPAIGCNSLEATVRVRIRAGQRLALEIKLSMGEDPFQAESMCVLVHKRLASYDPLVKL